MKTRLKSVLKSVFFAFLLVSGQLIIAQEQIVINKQIVSSPINCKQFDVTLTVTGNPPVAAKEVVLLIDVSGSMGNYVDDGTGTGNQEPVIKFVKEAAKDFVSKLLSSANNPTGKNKIAIVSYSYNAVILADLTTDKTALNNAIDQLSPDAGTNMEGGLLKAGEVFTNSSPGCLRTRSIVFFTDGLPNWHNGSPLPVSGECKTTEINSMCQQRAFSAATAIGNININGTSYNQSIFTVGFTGQLIEGIEKDNAKYTLDNIQNSGAYYTDNAADLTNMYSTILGELIPAATALDNQPLVVDQIPNEFQIVSSSLQSGSTINANKGTGLIVNNTINWEVDKILDETLTLKYSIIAADNFCGDNLSLGTSTIRYKNATCNQTNKKFDNTPVCIPCPVTDIQLNRQQGCSKTINYGSNSNPIVCSGVTETYLWKFFLKGNLVGTSANKTGKFTYTGSDKFTGNFKAELVYSSNCSLSTTNLEKSIILPNELSLSVLKSDLSCGGTDGGIDLSVTGGSGSYTYLWSNGATTQDLNNISTGLYTVTVTDILGCEKSISTTLISIDNDAPTLIVPNKLSVQGCDQNNINSANSRYKFSLTAVSLNIATFNNADYIATDDTNIAKITYKDEIISYDGCVTKVLRTFTVVDTCGKTETDSTIISITDTIKPTFTAPKDITISTDANCDFDVSVTKTGVVSDEADNCSTGLKATFTDVEKVGTCEGTKIITRTWNLTDSCGNSTQKDQIITVEDNIKPTFTAPDNITISTDVNCDFDVSVTKTGVVSDEADNCSTGLKATFTDVEKAGTCKGTKTITRTWNLTDSCGNSTQKDQIITVEDSIKPTFTAPKDITISTDANCDFDVSVTKTGVVSDEADNCSTGLKATFTDVEKVGTCEGTKIITRTWNLTDSCGNSTQKDQIITVEDNIKPTFTAPDNITISTDVNCDFDVSVTKTGVVSDEADNCSTGLKATFTDVEKAGTCKGTKTITRTWNLTDSCGNSTQKDQIITVEDSIKPTFTAPKDITISTDANCVFDISVAKTGGVSDEADNCSTGLKATFTDVEKVGTCEGTKTITRTWNLTDSCGNSTQKDQIITVEDNIKPTFTAPDNITISTDANCVFDVSVGKTGVVSDEADNCSTGLKATFTDVEKVGTCEGTKTITRTWNLTDSCGNSTQKDQIITVEDTIKPTFTAPDNITISTDANCVFDVSVGKTGVVSDEADNCSTGLKATFTDVEKAGTCEGTKTITRTWNLTDSCGNSTQKDQIITVEDNIKPTFTAPDNITISTDANCVFDVSVGKTGVVSDEADNCSTGLKATFTDVEKAGTCEGTKTITRTWNLTDSCGNSTQKDQIITVEDNIKPTFTAPKDITISTDANCTFDVSVGKTGVVSDEADNCSTGLKATFTDVEKAGTCEGTKTITRTWNLTDSCGNLTQKDQIITVEDNVKPTFTAPKDITISTDASCTFDVSVGKTGGVSDEADNCSTGLKATFTDVEKAGTCEGTKIITRTWILTDSCGNSTQKDQIITVKDSIKPTFTAPDDITISTDANCTFDVSVAKTGVVSDEADNCSTGLKATFTDVEKAGTCEGTKTITRTWNLTDSCGNSTQKDQIITVEDNIKPTFTAPKDITISTDANCVFDVSVGKTGVVSDEADNCSTGLKATFTDVEKAGTCEGTKTITRTWNLTDSCGNSTQKDQIITVEDNIKPTFTAPKDITISTDANCTFDVSVGKTGVVSDEADNCSTGLKATFTDVEKAGTCEGEKIITRTWNLTDSCGNSTQKDQIITVEDNIKPTFTAPKDITISTDKNCSYDISVAKTGGVSDEADNCSTGLKATFTDVEKAGTCEGTKTITRTWNLTDSCGNSTEKVQIITVEDNVKPTFTAPKDITISTDANCVFDASVGKTGGVSDEADNCSTGLKATFTDVEKAGTCEGEKIITRTWNLTDSCGNSTQKDQIITVEDNIKPTFTAPNDITISTDENCVFDASVGKTGVVSNEADNCSTGLKATFTDVEKAGTCEGTKTITRTWNLTDSCGNSTQKDQIITVEDNIKPTFTVPADITISTDANCVFDVSVGKTGVVSDEADNCSTGLKATFTDVEKVGTCEGTKTITRTWNLTDSCGNSTQKDQIITVEDTIKPTFTAPDNITISTDENCTFDVSVGKTGVVSDEADNCSRGLKATFTDVEKAGTCEGTKTITRTWNLTDSCGNSTQKDQIITVEDTIKPTFTAPKDITISTDENCDFDVSVEKTGVVSDEADNCSTGLKATFTDVEKVGTCEGTKIITRTWILTDSCGNSTQKDQIITVEDNIKPTFTAPDNITISTDTSCTFDVSVGKTGVVSDEADNCSTGLKATFTDVEKAGTCEGTKTITRTWILTDSCGNSTEKDQIITVEDIIKPTFTAPDNITISTDENCVFDVSVGKTGVVSDEADNCSTGLKATFTDVEKAGTCEGEKIITRTWNLTDSCGNSTQKDQIITVEDNIKPTFTAPDNITISTDANCTFDVSVTKTGVVSDEADNCSTGLKATFTDVEKVGTCEGTKIITRTWNLTDSCGNSTQKDQIITVEDNIKPTFTVPADITISTDANCVFDVSVGKTGVVSDEADNCSTGLKATFTDVEKVGTCEGTKTITRTWNLTDSCGNSTQKDQIITVEDTIKPTFTAPDDITISTDANCVFDVSVAKTGVVYDEADNCSTGLKATFTDVEKAGTCEGTKTITRTWNLTDSCGNSTQKDQIITVEDNIKPTFTAPDNITISTDANCDFDVSVAKTGGVSDEADNCSTGLKATFTDVEKVGTCEGTKTITRTWNLTDSCGNSTEKVQIITVEDNIKPTFTAPDNITISTDANCDSDVSVAKTGVVSDEADNCSTGLKATFTDVEKAGTCEGTKTITRTWNLTDSCGNSTQKDQIITVEDNIKPTFTAPKDITISTDANCVFDVSVGKTGVVSDEADNCSTGLKATFTDVEKAGTCEGAKTITRTWNLTDSCGNSTEKVQIITIEDNIKPTFTAPKDITISTDKNCSYDVSVGKTGVVSDEADNCSTGLKATFTDVEKAGTCEGTKTITRTWNLTDSCGNSTQKDQIITVEDTIKPTFTAPDDITISTDANCTFDVSVGKTGVVSDEADNCSTGLKATFTDVEKAGTCEGTKTITRTWNLTDSCGNSTQKDQIITVEDTIKPTFTAPDNITISTDANCVFDVSVAKTGVVSDEADNCSTGLKATFTDVKKAGTCEGTKIITRTWNLTDDCGNSTEKVQIITVKDTIKPTFTAPADITISTDANCVFDVSVGKTGVVSDEADNCSTGLKATFTDVEKAGTCEGAKTITRTWNLTDSCGNSTQKDQIITIEDTIKPTFTAPKDITISTDANCVFDVSVAKTGVVSDEADNCSTGLKATFTDVEKAGTCEGTKIITRTWNLTDSCGNSTQKDQIITVEDTIKPTFTAPDNITISTDANCVFDVSVGKTGVVSDEADNCSTGLKATFTDVEKAGTCEGTKIITRTWNLTDSCGNSTQKDQIITVEDTIKPTFTAPDNITISTDANCTFDVSVGKTGVVSDEADNCSTGLKATFTDVEKIGTCEGTKTITRTWNLTDSCGNSTQKDQIITVEDTIKPTFTAPKDITISTDENCTFDVSVAKTGEVSDEADNCSTGLKATFTDVEKAGTCEGTKTITRTWNLTDSCGNSTQKDQIITVEDNVKPTFTAPKDITISTDANCDFDVSVAKTGEVSDEADNCSTGLKATFTDVEKAGTCEGTKTITRTWNLTDSCGNSTQKDQIITVEDNVKPTFTAPKDITISTDANCDFDVSVAKTGVVSDEADNCSTGLKAIFTDVEKAGTCEGTKIITRTWNLTDSCGNSTQKDQIITVEDNIKPTFTAPDDITISTDASCVFDVSVGKTGVVSDEADNCSTGLKATFTDVEKAGTCEGTKTITRTWILTDSCGNSTEKVQIITIEDNIKPTFTAPKDITISTDKNCSYDVSVGKTGGVSDEADNCSTGLKATFTDVEKAGTCEGTKTITRTWNLTDSCGNSTEKVQIITVEDTIKPTFTAPKDITISTDANCVFDVSVAKTGVVSDEADNCSTGLKATFTDVEKAGTCEGTKTITRTWNLTDSCGNSTQKDQIITVEDNIKPTFTGELPQNITVSCDEIPEVAVLSVSDNCSLSSDLELVYTQNVTRIADQCDSEYRITRTWNLKDCAGNISSYTQQIKVVDNDAPELVTDINDINVSCDEIPEIPTIEFIDNCSSNNIQVAFEEHNTFDGSDNDYVITRNWTAIDLCGNVANFTQNISVTVKQNITEITDSKCIDDGEINLNDYLVENNISSEGKWTLVKGDGISLSVAGIFDPLNLSLGNYTFDYTTFNEFCTSVTRVVININDQCTVLPCGQDDIKISKAVTPNGDSWNQYFKVTGAESCGFRVNVKIFNRWGARVYKSNNYANNWNGVSEGLTFGNAERLPAGTYYYIVLLENSGLKPFTGAIYLATK
ncbi:gliding motility-associated C-terminal domain-containing protein [Tenacibaculum finnmarkense]|uniref:T9SS type B sorting domain-containing protein n=1 Tax=Tenacibaculum finnmarkense TaxID=2781243 RepID=UPI0023010D5E|nr:gliding motility-associated C-terminal domain-containing protein [Tenacibaculum finnmarkense]WCC48072.1 gliding motility-associated C-terminal domain-containing protein [Tenacibaculum finnmarkense]